MKAGDEGRNWTMQGLVGHGEMFRFLFQLGLGEGSMDMITDRKGSSACNRCFENSSNV